MGKGRVRKEAQSNQPDDEDAMMMRPCVLSLASICHVTLGLSANPRGPHARRSRKVADPRRRSSS